MINLLLAILKSMNFAHGKGACSDCPALQDCYFGIEDNKTFIYERIVPINAMKVCLCGLNQC